MFDVSHLKHDSQLLEHLVYLRTNDWFDGDVVVTYHDRDDPKDWYIKYWAASFGRHNTIPEKNRFDRYLLFQADHNAIALFEKGIYTWYQVILLHKGSNVWIVDEYHSRDEELIYKVNIKDLPEDYLPFQDTFRKDCGFSLLKSYNEI